MEDEQLGEQFVANLEEEGRIDEFCESVDADTEKCKVAVADKLTEAPAGGAAPPEPQAPPEQVPENGMTVVGDEEEVIDEDIQHIVADCVGRSRFLGIGRPNEHACKRAFEKQEHRIQRLERKVKGE